MRAIYAAVVTAAALLVGACEPQPPHWADVCVAWRTDLIPMAMPQGNGQVTVTLTPISSCDRYERQCVVDKRLPGECK